MRIAKIEKTGKSSNYITYLNITFKNRYGKTFKKVCIYDNSKWLPSTKYATNGDYMGRDLNYVVKAFMESGGQEHTYIKEPESKKWTKTMVVLLILNILSLIANAFVALQEGFTVNLLCAFVAGACAWCILTILRL